MHSDVGYAEECSFMAIAFSLEVYLKTQDMFSVGCTITPIKSNPTGPAYGNRGIYSTRPIDIVGLDGSIVSDQQSIFDIRELEYTILPMRGDMITIPADCNGVPLGDFEVMDADTNGGGETTLSIRRIETAKP
jgi:hypothetical protein